MSSFCSFFGHLNTIIDKTISYHLSNACYVPRIIGWVYTLKRVCTHHTLSPWRPCNLCSLPCGEILSQFHRRNWRSGSGRWRYMLWLQRRPRGRCIAPAQNTVKAHRRQSPCPHLLVKFISCIWIEVGDRGFLLKRILGGHLILHFPGNFHPQIFQKGSFLFVQVCKLRSLVLPAAVPSGAVSSFLRTVTVLTAVVGVSFLFSPDSNC